MPPNYQNENESTRKAYVFISIFFRELQNRQKVNYLLISQKSFGFLFFVLSI